jgi:hypothetical protein
MSMKPRSSTRKTTTLGGLALALQASIATTDRRENRRDFDFMRLGKEF